jgi:S-ribosylhomocysteine lyase LuxS involved in autoinducer biosynthesis
MPNPNNPEIAAHQAVFSSNVDHTKMTGGTFEVRKRLEVVNSPEALMNIYIVKLPFNMATSTEETHKGMHTLEHGLVYAGGVRKKVSQLKNNPIDYNAFVDISPYVDPKDGSLGFRILSLATINPQHLLKIIRNAFEDYKVHLKRGHVIPFASPEECGQFEFHDRNMAMQMIDQSRNKIAIQKKTPLPFSKHVAVGDLRLLKPQLSANPSNQIFLTPDASYTIAQTLETQFGASWQQLGYGDAPQILIGNYGCMTGEYPVVEAPHPEEDITMYQKKVHAALAHSLAELADKAHDLDVVIDAQLALGLIETYSPQVFADVKNARTKSEQN